MLSSGSKTITLRMNNGQHIIKTNIAIDQQDNEIKSCPTFDKLKQQCGEYFLKVNTYVQSFGMKYNHEDDTYYYSLLDDENVRFMFEYFRKKVKENSNFTCIIICDEDSVERQIVDKLLHKYSKIIERDPIYRNRSKQVWVYRVKSDLVVKITAQEGVEYDSEVWKEVKRTKEYSHPLIIKIGDIFNFKINGMLYVAYEMKYFEHGTLQNVISNQINLSETNIVFIMIQVAFVLGYIQQKNKAIHRDIRLPNIFIESIIPYDEGKELYRIVVADFEFITYENNASIFSLAGARCYAPEVKEGKAYSFSSDVFTLGVLLFQLMTRWGIDIFDNENYLERVEQVLIEKNCYTLKIINLVASMIQKEPEKRPTICSILREGRLYFGEGIVNEYNALLEVVQQIYNETTDSNAQYTLGAMYDTGKIVPQDYLKAFEYYEMASKQRNADAQFNLGYMYYNGKGVSQDYLKAFEYYEMASKQGNANAQFNLGYMYYNGEGVSQDYLKALKYYEMASKQGDTDAQKQVEKIKSYTNQSKEQDRNKDNCIIS